MENRKYKFINPCDTSDATPEISEIPEKITRGRGRPRKNLPVCNKEKKPVGRPKKYEHRYTHKRISCDEYDRLKKIEEKYLKIIMEINI